ncbi:MAG: protease complex subunit PrcB family protein [Lachnospiraceae bacterium]|nr:protease complex subunit PrcB family protein [Lachnospiraceae bacterium]
MVIKMKRCMQVFLIVGISVLLCSCGSGKEEVQKGKALEYTVVTDNEMPEELKANLEEKKIDGFKITYTDNGYLYICVGYGEQKSGGYSIFVKDLYLSENAIYIDTNLSGPTLEEAESSGKSYPYIVIKTEFIDKTVVFD